MKRWELMDILENIQDKNNKENIGSNEAELSTREDIADLFFKLFNKANEFKTNNKREALIAFCEWMDSDDNQMFFEDDTEMVDQYLKQLGGN